MKNGLAPDRSSGAEKCPRIQKPQIGQEEPSRWPSPNKSRTDSLSTVTRPPPTAHPYQAANPRFALTRDRFVKTARPRVANFPTKFIPAEAYNFITRLSHHARALTSEKFPQTCAQRKTDIFSLHVTVIVTVFHAAAEKWRHFFGQTFSLGKVLRCELRNDPDMRDCYYETPMVRLCRTMVEN